MTSPVTPLSGPVPVLTPPQPMSSLAMSMQEHSSAMPTQLPTSRESRHSQDALEVADGEECGMLAVLPHSKPHEEVRDLLAKQTFSGIFEGLRPGTTHAFKHPVSLAIFRVIESHAYERPGLSGDKEYLVGSEFILP